MLDFIHEITLYRDDDILVLNKPSGLLSVPGKGDLTDSLLTRVKEVDSAALLVHRLDRDTSGIIVFARNPAAQTHLSKQFAARIPSKTYQALVEGKPLHGQGVINAPVRYNPLDPPKHIIDFDHPKQAVSLYNSFESILVEDQLITPILLQPYTGRSHQLRVHMQHQGHPILNDPLYSTVFLNDVERLALHAARLTIQHPVDMRPLMFYCNAPFNCNLKERGVFLPASYLEANFPEYPKTLLPSV